VQVVLKGLREGRYWMAAGQQTILVVEDDPAIRSFIVEALEGEGYTVAEAVDGAQAIDILEQPRPPLNHLCLVLLDMMLPRVDGCGVLHHLAQLNSSVAVIAMSASSRALSAATDAGAQAALAKPFDLHRLLAAVARNCEAPATE
jgi:CheY-like chemotaxis protein